MCCAWCWSHCSIGSSLTRNRNPRAASASVVRCTSRSPNGTVCGTDFVPPSSIVMKWSCFFDRDEVELIVDAPVVRHHVRRAVLEHQLRVARRAREDERVRWHWRQRVRWHWRDEIPHRIRKRSGDAVSKEYRRTRCELHDNHSAPYSCQWRLREGCSIRNEQSEKRETNCATHASPPRVLLTAVTCRVHRKRRVPFDYRLMT